VETIWFGLKLAVGFVLGIFALYWLLVLIGAVADSLRAGPSERPVNQTGPHKRALPETIGSFEQDLLAHENAVRRLGSDMPAVERERRTFALRVGLLSEFSDRLLGESCGQRQYERYGYKYRQDGDIWEYRFGIEGREYTVSVNGARQYSVSPPGEREYDKHCRIHDDEGRLVFDVKRTYREDFEKDLRDYGPRYDISDDLEAFIPGMWVRHLLERTLALMQDEERQTAGAKEEYKRWMDERRREKFLG
jgi:hypothetical protein